MMNAKTDNPCRAEVWPSTAYLPLMCLGVILTYFRVFEYPYFISEYGLFYNWNADLTPADWLENYNPFREGWYRPSAFILQYQLLTLVVGWHDIFALQCVAVLTMIGVALCVRRLAMLLLDNPALSAFAGFAAATHPVFFILPTDLIFFDAMYVVAMVLALHLFFSSFEVEGRWRLRAVAALYVFALTCKEQSFVLPFAFVVILALRALIFRESILADRRRLVYTAAMCVLGTTFCVIRLVCQGWAGGDYRSGFDIPGIMANFLAGATWIFRLFPWSTPTWDGIAYQHWADFDATLFAQLWRELTTSHAMWHPASALVGLAILTVCVVGSIRAWKTGKERERWILASLWVSLALFSALPVYNGGRPWHFAMPAICSMTILAISEKALLSRIPVPFANRLLLLAALCLAILGAYDFGKDREKRFVMNHINHDALVCPPLPSEAIPAGARIFYPAGRDAWAYGSGQLFEYVYLRPDIEDVPIASIADVMNASALRQIASGEAFLFVYDHDARRWTNEGPGLLERASLASDAALCIDFSRGGDSGFYTTEGWSGQEETGIWTVGQRASLRIPGLAEGGRRIKIWMEPFVKEGHPSLAFSVLANGFEIARLECRMGEVWDYPLVMDIPKVAASGESLDLTILIDNPASPASIGMSGDPRILGIFVRRIELCAEK